MKYITSIVFILFSIIPASAQLTPADIPIIKDQLLKRINTLREKVGVQPLKIYENLSEPAEMHSVYMAENDTLSHSQSSLKYRTPEKRVIHFAPNQFDIIGENILFTRRVKFPLRKNAAIRIANEMFEAWKESPPHYANMIEGEYDATNFGFKINDKKQIYATNLFGRKGVKIEGQLSDNAFGLLEDEEGDCFEGPEFYSNILVNVGNAVFIKGDKIMLYYHDKERFFKMFAGARDGIAVDLIDASQFDCGHSNQLDMSPIYDGVLLEPVYRDELRANNTAKNNRRLITRVGEVPKELQGKDLTFVVLLIQNGVVCRQVIPSEVEGKSYPLKKLKVHLDHPEKAIQSNQKIIESLTIPFNFDANQTKPKSFPLFLIESKNILSVSIRSYSSIEGNADLNERLHKERAKSIRKFLQKELSIGSGKFNIKTKENWEEFYFQLKYHYADTLIQKSKNELRTLANDRAEVGIPWDSLLYEQRKSFATIYYESSETKPTDSSALLISNLEYAILNNDILSIQKALFDIYHFKNIDAGKIFDENIFELLMTEPDLVKNTAAVLSRFYQNDLKQSIKFVNKWLNTADELSLEARFNLLNLYAIINNQLLDKWDVSSKRLANVIHPRYVSELSKVFESDEMMLNLHLTFIKFYGQVNDGEGIDISFDFISDYFSKRALKVQDIIALAKFYNKWSMYRMANAYLLDQFEKGRLNEDAIFLLLQTLHYFSGDDEMDDYDFVYQKAKKLNQNRWCHWINRNIQLVRDKKIKGIYCHDCF